MSIVARKKFSHNLKNRVPQSATILIQTVVAYCREALPNLLFITEDDDERLSKLNVTANWP